jgi:flavodoxin
VKRVLVVYYSHSGHTEFVARQIAAHCHADLERIEDRHSRRGLLGYLRSMAEAVLGLRPAIERMRHRPGDYDLVIVGTPVWCWNVASPLRTWLKRHRSALNNVAVFCTCGRSGHAKALDDLEALCEHRALARLALTERAVGQCQREPAFRRFMRELKRVRSVSVSLPPAQDQATA